MSNTHQLDDLQIPTDADINILHDIVQRAQDAEDKTSRALFQAHDAVLAESGINPNREQKYVRFLLRMREGPQNKTKAPIEQFTGLLSRLGIRVVFDEDDQGSTPDKDVERPIATQSQALAAEASRGSNAATRSRRASFNEYEESGQVLPYEDIVHKTTLPTRPASENQLRNGGMKVNGTRPPNGSALSAGQNLNNGVHDPFHVDPQPKRKPVVQIREDPSIYEFEQSVASDEVSSTDEDDSRDLQKPKPTASNESPVSEEDVKARDFRFRRLAVRAHRIFHDWQVKTNTARNRNRQKSAQALRQHGNFLGKQALEQWRDKFLARKREEDTNAFFEALEKRAERARNLFLLTKSFTHWAQSASDEIVRTSAARRHILRTRYFNAWRDITAVNELKVRRQGISRFFQAWKKRSTKVLDLERSASDFRTSRLAQVSYRDWFWEFCDRRAPLYHDTRIQERCWDHWSQLAQGYAIRDRWSENFARVQTLRKIWVTWSDQLHRSQQVEAKAHSFRRRTLVFQNVEAWRRKLFFADPVGRMTKARTTKLVTSTFQTWLDQARLSLVSKKTHDLRVMRNAWTNWNDRLRSQALGRVIDDRLVTQALYKWVIAQRLALLQRVALENKKLYIIRKWKQQTRRTCSSVGEAEHWVSLARTTRLKAAILRKLREQAEARRQQEIQAIQISRRKSLTITTMLWTSRWRRTKELDGWAKWGQYLVLAAPALKQWQTKLEARKKSKRRDAYITIRRRQREAAMRGLFSTWRDATRLAADDTERASRQYAYALSSSKLVLWRDRLQQLSSQCEQVQKSREDRQLQRAWSLIVDRLDNVRVLDSQADERLLERDLLPAGKSIKRLRFRLLQVQGLEKRADEFRQRTEEHRHWLMLRNWRDLAANVAQQRQNQQSPPPSPSPAMSNARRQQHQPVSKAQQLAQSVSTIPHTAVAAASLVATPAYLQTPSRRTTGRLRPRMQPPPATLEPSFVTPYISKMRAQYPGVLSRSTRRVGRDRRREAEDIPESDAVEQDGEM